jgi:ergothioneine biosynthesis protein EgtB
MPAAQEEIAVRYRLLERVFDARRHSDALFSLVRADSMYERPIPERHRIIFYLGHLEAFDWNLLHESVLGLGSFHSEFDQLFAFGIDPVGGGLPSDRPADWPSLKTVHDYVARIRANLDERLAEGVLEPHAHTRDGFSLDILLNVAIEHRLMHVETLAYMLHPLPLDRKIHQVRPPKMNLPKMDAPSPIVPPPNHRMVEIPPGTATLGLARRGDSFGWDNEYDAHTLQMPAFEIDQYMVTNGQYLDFMAAGGYETRDFWSDDDWNWKTAHDVSYPVFWENASGGWLYRTMFDEIPLPLDWPVYVSHAEAAAYARWAGKSLPTETEWHRAAYGTMDGSERPYPWGSEQPNSNFGNFDFDRWDPAPVNAFPRGRSAFGVDGMLGNGWEWTSTVFAPFPGFEPFPFYRGYSADFFDGKHFVMKGASARTAACMLRSTFRNWFQAHYQHVYAGFRCVRR